MEASVLELARDWLAAGERVALATVVATWSSSPRPVGSQMAIAAGGQFAGSVSGGCVESAVIVAARELLASGSGPRALRYGVSLEQAWEVGLPCGGQIAIQLAEASLEVLEAACAARARRETIAIITDLDSGREVTWTAGAPIPEMSEATARAVEGVLQRERSELVEVGGNTTFVQVVASPLRLIAVGAVHLTQALSQLARSSGIDVWVVDPRTAFATPERFPGVNLEHEWPDVALSKIGLDRRTAVVVLSHDQKLDEPALHAALASDCFYVGALGSQRTQRARRERLAAAGFDAAAIARIHGPIGLDIGASSPSEIAIAILAELIQAWRGRFPRRRAAERSSSESDVGD